jgi:hypothetical protein
MSEAMSVETVVEALWQMQGYWTRLRFAFQTSRGGWSDVDVLAYRPESRHLVIAESKVRGPKEDVYAYTKNTHKRWRSILRYDRLDGGKQNYFSFLEHIPVLCRDGPIFSSFESMVRCLTVQLVSNYYISEDVYDLAVHDIEQVVSPKIPKKVSLCIDLKTTFDVVAKLIELEHRSSQGRRYGHPVLDLARELNRYLHARVRDAGRGKEQKEQVRSYFLDRFEEAIRAK